MVQEKIEQDSQLGACREQSCVASNATVGVERVAVIHFADEQVAAPSIPQRRIAAVSVAKGRVIDNVLFVDVAHLRRREFSEALLFRIEGRVAKPEWLVERAVDKHIEPLSADMLDDDAKQHEAEVAVVTAFADAPLESHVANRGVG